MNRIITRVFGLLCAFILPFCLVGCNLGSIFGYPSGKGYQPSGGGTGGSGEAIIPSSTDFEFEQDDEGNYVYYSDYIETFDGVRILYIPDIDEESDNEDTNAERERYKVNLYTQFEVLSEYILTYLVREFGDGSAVTEIMGSDENYGSDYTLPISSGTPCERNAGIFDSNEFVIEQVFNGWIYDGTTLGTDEYNTSVHWESSLGTTLLAGETYLGEYLNSYKNFLILRLMEEVLTTSIEDGGFGYFISELNNEGKKSSQGFASGEAGYKTRVGDYLKLFNKLGFTMGDISNENSIVNKIASIIFDEFIGSNVLEYNNGKKEFSEPWYDVDGNGEVDDGEFVDMSEDLVYNTITYQPNSTSSFYVDYGQFKEIENEDGSKAKVMKSYDGIIGQLLLELQFFVDGGYYVDNNGDGEFNVGEIIVSDSSGEYNESVFPDIYGIEVQDLTSKEFFRPGIPATSDTPRTLDNMKYAQYNSVVFTTKDITKFDTFTIYVDPESNFSMNVWLKIHIDMGENGVTYTKKLIKLNLDNEQSCDWCNDEINTPKTDEENSDFDEEDSWTDPEQLLNDEPRNAVWIAELSELLDESAYNIIAETGLPSTVDKDENGNFKYTERGHHSNFGKQMTNYSMQELKDGESEEDKQEDLNKMVLYNGEETYFEFIFEIVDPDPEEEYNFRFLITLQEWDLNEEDFDEEDFE